MDHGNRIPGQRQNILDRALGIFASKNVRRDHGYEDDAADADGLEKHPNIGQPVSRRTDKLRVLPEQSKRYSRINPAALYFCATEKIAIASSFPLSGTEPCGSNLYRPFSRRATSFPETNRSLFNSLH